MSSKTKPPNRRMRGEAIGREFHDAVQSRMAQRSGRKGRTRDIAWMARRVRRQSGAPA